MASGNLLSDGERVYTYPAKNMRGERRPRQSRLAALAGRTAVYRPPSTVRRRTPSPTTACPSASLRDAARGDRLRHSVPVFFRETVDPAQNGGANGGVATNYTLDLNTGLTQVLSDGANAYLYGIGRIGEEQPGGWQYHRGDALGSLRQLIDGAAHEPAHPARGHIEFSSGAFCSSLHSLGGILRGRGQR
ncbi:MAG TPA: hypothetical protein VJ123_10435 [Anaerolineales bacterium]|nr:hypothetical protein [Anaerolineales bacterium]